MKKIFYGIVAALCFFTSCKKDDGIDEETQKQIDHVQRMLKIEQIIGEYSGYYNSYKYDIQGEMVYDECYFGNITLTTSEKGGHNATTIDVSMVSSDGKINLSTTINKDDLSYESGTAYDDSFSMEKWEVTLPKSEIVSNIDILDDSVSFRFSKDTFKGEEEGTWSLYMGINNNQAEKNISVYYFDVEKK